VFETLRWFPLALALMAGAGCYRPPAFDRCQVTCSAAGECPEGATCLGDGYCHAGSDQTADCTPIDAGTDGGGGASGDAVAVGSGHSCAILGDGRIACWGRGSRGQLGTGSLQRTATPTIVDGGPWTALATGDSHTCALAASDGAMWCWGANTLGQAGNDGAADEPVPTEVDTAITGWTAVTGGGVHTCGLAEGRLYCWGGNGYDQLGLGNDDDPVRAPVPVGAETTWEAISAGYFHTCGIRDGGRLFCWGANPDGRLGVGDANPRDTPAEVDAAGMRWRAVAAGGSHSCGIRVDGSLWCWGYSGSGQAGAGGDEPQMLDEGPWRDVAATYTHSCGVTEDDELFCWGDDSLGQRGDGLGSGAGPLVRIGESESWAAVARGIGTHTCARTTGGDFHCWGDAGDGQVGDGELVDEHAPQQVPGGAGWTRVAAGGDQTCGLRAGELLCWGGYWERQSAIETTPTVLDGGTGWLTVAVGAEHGCAIDGASHLWCWGDGSDGELGNGGVADSAAPIAIEPTREWLDVTIGRHHTCAVEQLTGGATAGPVWCWGANFDAQIRDPAMSGSSSPVETLAPADFDEVSAGISHTCAHRNGDNELHCWGGNGDGQTTSGTNPAWPPAPVPNAGWTTVGAGEYHACGILVDDVFCWGDNDRGQLGLDETAGFSASPVAAAPAGEWDGVAGGGSHACAIEVTAPAPHELWCWGGNDDGALGAGEVDVLLDPVRVGSTIDWRQVAAGYRHTCGIDAGGVLWCWGDDNLGQLGDGQSNRYAPVPVAPAVEP
jgi:alpha-tubulin suppressor-like RCC1 family protein